jgi:hypothetical protein
MTRSVVSLLTVALFVGVQAPSVESVLARAGEYVAQSRQDLAALVAEEYSVQIQRNYGVQSGDLPGLGESSGHTRRSLRSELVLLATPGRNVWHTYRHTFALNERPVDDQKDRLRRIFSGPPAAAVAEATRLSNENARFNLGAIRRNMNLPTLALEFLAATSQPGFSFTKKGEKKVDGVPAWVIAFVEVRRPSLISTPDGRSLPVRGEIWVDPANGRVMKTQVTLDSLDAFKEMKERPQDYSAFPRVAIETTFRLDRGLNAWVPAEMKEFYDRGVEVVTCTVTYTNYSRLEIDLTALVPKG